ncbi:MAG: DUF1963 domain-containing protein [Eubacteriales bacterium]
MSKFEFFWETMKKCNWRAEGNGDSEKVLKPVVDYLASLDDIQIFQFGSQMTKLLYDLDTRKNFEEYVKVSGHSSDDGFLYARCVALINSEHYYKYVKSGINTTVWCMDFESLLYVPENAWGQKHGKDSSECPNYCLISYETGSNKAMWQKEETEDGWASILAYDKAIWHIENGVSEEEIVAKFTVIFTFLKENKMLSEDGLELLEDGIDESISFHKNLVNEKGRVFLDKYYTELVDYPLKKLKDELKQGYLEGKYTNLVVRLDKAVYGKKYQNYTLEFLKGATLKNSKIGGCPYIPKGGEIPRNAKGEPLLMIAQLNLSEFPVSSLPYKEGILQFWIGMNENYGADFQNPCSGDNARVIYYPTIQPSLTKKAVAELFSEVDLEGDLQFPLEKPWSNEYKFRDGFFKSVRPCPKDVNYSNYLVKIYNEAYPDQPITNVLDDILTPAKQFPRSNKKANEFLNPVIASHFKTDINDAKFLGYPTFLQEDPRKSGFPELRDYVLLFQLSSKKLKHGGLNWGNEGKARWMIHPDDLAKGDFSKVWYGWDCV